MSKLLVRDKKKRLSILKMEKRLVTLNLIFRNLAFSSLIRWNAFLILAKIVQNSSNEISLSNRCVYTGNKKRFNKLTSCSRHVFLKLLRAGSVTGIKKSSW